MPAPYNYIYSKLVADESDLIGRLAYSIYKQHKIEFIESHQAEHGRDPSEAEFSAFYRATNTNHELESYRQRATGLFDEISERLLEHKAEQVRCDLEAGSQVLAEIRSLKKPLWRSVFENILAAAITSILAALITVVFLINWVGADKLWDMVVQKAAAFSYHQGNAPDVKR